MKAKCINFKKGQKTKEPKYFLYMDSPNKINLEFDDDTYIVELIINNEFAAKIDYDNFLENVSDFIYDAMDNDIFEFNFTDTEFYKHFKNVDIKWLEAF